MGSFDMTCAISRTGIKMGDEVLFVGTARDDWDTYSLEQDYLEYINYIDERVNPFRFVKIGLYNDYGNIKGFEDSKAKEIKIGFGLQIRDDWYKYQFMVHRTIAEYLLGRPLDVDNLTSDVMKLLNIAYRLRIQLQGTGILGRQFIDLEEMKSQRKLIAKIDQFLSERIKEYKHEYGE